MKVIRTHNFRGHPAVAPVITLHVFKTRVTNAAFCFRFKTPRLHFTRSGQKKEGESGIRGHNLQGCGYFVLRTIWNYFGDV